MNLLADSNSITALLRPERKKIPKSLLLDLLDSFQILKPAIFSDMNDHQNNLWTMSLFVKGSAPGVLGLTFFPLPTPFACKIDNIWA